MDAKDLKEVVEYMKTPEFEEKARKYIEEHFRELEKRRNQVSSNEYIDWLYNYLSVNKSVDDESALYQYEGIDKEYGSLVSYFLSYVKELAKKQRVMIASDEECEFYNQEVVVKIKDKYFKIFQIHGQGAWTCISPLENEPDYAFVKL